MIKKDEVLYSLCAEDIYSVAKDMGVPDDKITEEVIEMVVRGWQDGLQWYEVTEIALQNALES